MNISLYEDTRDHVILFNSVEVADVMRALSMHTSLLAKRFLRRNVAPELKATFVGTLAELESSIKVDCSQVLLLDCKIGESTVENIVPVLNATALCSRQVCILTTSYNMVLPLRAVREELKPFVKVGSVCKTRELAIENVIEGILLWENNQQSDYESFLYEIYYGEQSDLCCTHPGLGGSDKIRLDLLRSKYPSIPCTDHVEDFVNRSIYEFANYNGDDGVPLESAILLLRMKIGNELSAWSDAWPWPAKLARSGRNISNPWIGKQTKDCRYRSMLLFGKMCDALFRNKANPEECVLLDVGLVSNSPVSAGRLTLTVSWEPGRLPANVASTWSSIAAALSGENERKVNALHDASGAIIQFLLSLMQLQLMGDYWCLNGSSLSLEMKELNGGRAELVFRD